MKSTISFISGVRSVTGAHFVLSSGDWSVAIDCGLIQGKEFADRENAAPFPYDPSSLKYLLVTHAHIDHIGRIPHLVRSGFKGEIISTPETKALASLMLEDAYRIMAEEARAEERERIWEMEDLDMLRSLWRELPYHQKFALGDDFWLVFKDAGHILGSAMCEISRAGKTVLFTGDLGNTPTPLLRDTESPEGANYIVMESVYGDRNHENKESRGAHLKFVIERTIRERGTLLIPAFSLEKTQVILHEINDLVEGGIIPRVPVYLDSPLAKKVTEVYRAMRNNFNEEIKSHMDRGDDMFTFPKLVVSDSVSDSKDAVDASSPKIVIAGSGMSTGGRILHYEKRYLPDPKATILFVGYQVPGSLGREIQDGAKKVKVDGKTVEVRARVETVIGYSSHKDSDNLLSFVESAGPSLKKVFVVMGELKSSLFLVQRIRDYLGVEAVSPGEGERQEIEL